MRENQIYAADFQKTGPRTMNRPDSSLHIIPDFADYSRLLASLPLPQRASRPPVFFVKPAATQSVHPDSSSAPAADSADFAILSALPIPALPAVSKQARSRQPTPLTNFPACPGQPMFVKKFCAADLPRRASSCTNLRCRFFPLVASLPLPQWASSPPVFFVKPTTTNRPDSSSAPAADSADFADSSPARCV